MKKITTLLVSACLCVCTAHASDVAGTVKSVKGQVHIERGTQRLNVSVGTNLLTQDKIVSGADSTVGVTLRDSTLLTAGPNSIIELNKYAFDRNTNIGHMDTSVKRGTLAVVSGQMAKNNPGQVVFRTSSITLGVRGTEFIVDVGP